MNEPKYPCGSCDVPKYGHYYGYCDNCEKLENYKIAKEKYYNESKRYRERRREY